METNVIYNEDCLETMNKLDEKSIDVILTSPPYNTSRKGSSLSKPCANIRYDDFDDCRTNEEYIEWPINIFNQLYVDYIISGKTEFQFRYGEFKIGSFMVSRASYVDKFTDITHYEDKNDFLGHKEWMFEIGCHTLWFDDIKDFARYYNLQDKLSFPLDRTTAECMENHLIHLPSGRTIEAVGTIDI